MDSGGFCAKCGRVSVSWVMKERIKGKAKRAKVKVKTAKEDLWRWA